MSYIVILDDDPLISKMIERMTTYKVIAFRSLKSFTNVYKRYKPIAAFLDVYIGTDENGLDIIPALKQEWPYTPIIVMSGSMDVTLLSQALTIGAVDFIAKPLKKEELNARLSTRIFEQLERAQNLQIPIGLITFDTQLNTLTYEDRRSFLTPMSANVLKTLAREQGQIVPRDALKRACWGTIAVSDNTIDAKLSEIRNALRNLDQRIKIQSQYGKGICLLVDTPAKKVKCEE